MASREVSTMIKQGFISDPSLAFSPSRTTALSKISSPTASPPPPPPPNESTRPSHSNLTLFEMMSEEHNRESKTLDESRKKSHARVAKILTDFKNGIVYAYGLGPGDVRLTVVGRDGYRVTMDVHRRVLSEKSRFFMEKMSSRKEKGVSHMVEISECDDVEVYVETVVLMYCDDLKKRLVGENVCKILALLKVSAAIMFDEGVMSCLEYLEAVPWTEEEEEMVVSCLGELDLPDLVTSILQRVSSESSTSSSSRTDDIYLQLLTGVLQAKDDKARREMKSLIYRLLREESDHDVSKNILYSLCHRCLTSLVLCLSEATSQMNDPGKDRGVLMREIAREADNLVWVVDILIEKKFCEDFVKLWADQKELADLHSKIPTMYRHEISRITALICVGIGKGRILVNREARFSVLNTWLEALYDDFGWMRRASSRSLDRKVVEEGLSQTILTLSLRQQQVILMKWFDRFLSKGDDCPNVQRAFEVWWRRAFVRQVVTEADASQLQITLYDYPK
ncbi:PREDICTED: BTB/POZ domain-containing protein At5g60050 [Tarenaya hassleriana]|uniref:BTB/POZ domain-containing protein At5g60050 n=1 Tax=Tarenaya hassleriana TaxID=28532 RepID=UPI00053C0CDE|nr:PREDICTED: BTB/POZ domain-containing protein At5g60050 [Tarenaya hassleriana]